MVPSVDSFLAVGELSASSPPQPAIASKLNGSTSFTARRPTRNLPAFGPLSARKGTPAREFPPRLEAVPRRWLNRHAVPADEGFQGVVLGQADLVVLGGGVGVAVLGPLPEFARVAAGEEGLVLLALVHEDRLPLLQNVARRQRHGDLDFVQFVLLPGPAIQQHFRPAAVLGLVLQDRPKDRLGADPVRAVRIRQ